MDDATNTGRSLRVRAVPIDYSCQRRKIPCTPTRTLQPSLSKLRDRSSYVEYNLKNLTANVFKAREASPLLGVTKKQRYYVDKKNVSSNGRHQSFGSMLDKLREVSAHGSRHTRSGCKSRRTTLSSPTDGDKLMTAISDDDIEAVYDNLLSDDYYVSDDHVVKAISSDSCVEVHKMLLCRYFSVYVWHDAEGYSFLHIAAKFDRYNIIPVLVESNPHLVSAVDRRNRTPLHIACLSGNLSSIRVLLHHGCDVNARDMDGYTPLMWSIDAPVSCAVELLNSGADPTLLDRSGKSTLYWTIIKGFFKLAKELMQRGVWFDRKSLGTFAEDMSLGLEKFPVILDLRPIEVCREYLLQNIRNGSEQSSTADNADLKSDTGSSIVLCSPVPEAVSRETRRRKHEVMLIGNATTSSFLHNYSNAKSARRRCPLYPVTPEMIELCSASLDKVPRFIYNPTEPINDCAGCKCITRCDLNPNCPCILRNGQKSPYRKDRTYDFTTHQIFECSPSCACNNTCTLRTTQGGTLCPLVVCSIEGKGLGVMTTVAIPAGTFVCEYVGETVSRKSLEKQEDKQQQSLFRVKTQGASFVTYAIEISDKSREFYVDSAKVGNVGRFFNHSCEPNMRIVKVDRGGQCPILGFFTNTAVSAGGELTWKYKTGSNQKSGQKCRCGASRCAGYV